MLAYVFWHWPYPDVDPKSYEKTLLAFHKSLGEARPEGFLSSLVFRLDGAPWIEADGGYEDWYLLEGSFALDRLNDAAVSERCREAHDRAAENAAGGTAGLYQLRRGKAKWTDSRYAVWLEKPGGMSYEGFYKELHPWTEQPGLSLWGRQMVLGPTPEFCLLAPEEPELPGSFSPSIATLRLLWH